MKTKSSPGFFWRILICLVAVAFIARSSVGWADQGYVPPFAPIPLADAVDAPTLTWTTGGAAPWLGALSTSAHDGVDWGASGDVADGGESWLETTVAGPGEVRFWWKVSSQAGSDFAEFLVDGVVQNDRLSGELDWRQVVRTLGPGVHTLRWRYVKDGSGSAGADTAWVDEVAFSAQNPPTFAAAIELAQEVWSSGTVRPWQIDLATFHGGAAALRSSPVGASEEAWIETQVAGPGLASFWWKVSSQINGDYLEFYIDGVLQAGRISGTVDWTLKGYEVVGAGPHTLRWRYVKDASTDAGSDAAWLDQVSFTPGPTLVDALDDPAGIWTTGGAADWRGQALTTHDGTDAARCGNITDSQESWIERSVSGPGWASFWWKVSSQSTDYLEFYIDGVLQTGRISGEVNWQRKEIEVPGAGAHLLRWRYVKDAATNAGQDAGWVDEFAYAAITPVTLTAALDNPALAWTGGGTAPFSGGNILNHDGVDAARSGVIGDSQESTMQTTVNGAGVVTFWWKVSSQSGGDFLEFYVDNVLQTGPISGEVGWARKEYIIPTAGPHTLKWRYTKDAATVSGSDAGWVDEVSFAPVVLTVPLATALDGAGLTWTAGGATPWAGTNAPNHDNAESARSGVITHGQESWMQTTVNGSGLVSFWWKVSADASDYLEFYIDGVLQTGRISGEVDWALVRMETVGAGAHTLRWRYVKDASVTGGSDAGWVDEVSFVPAPTLAAALDATGLTWTTGGSVDWRGQVLTTFDGVDAARAGAIVDSQETWLETTVPGPGQFSFRWLVLSSPTDFLEFYIDGVLQPGRISGMVGAWNSRFYDLLGAGPRTLRWRYVKDASGTASADTGYVDQVLYVPAPTLPVALDGAGLTWNTTGDLPWRGQTFTSHDGADAAQTGAIGDSQSTTLETSVSGPGTLSFWWRVSSALTDYLEFYVDGVLQTERLSGPTGDWRRYVRTLGAGAHTLQWRYAKDASGKAGSDTGWVDEVLFVPENPPALVAATEYAGGDLTTSGSGGAWSMQTAVTHDGVDALRTPVVGESRESWIESVVVGPGALSFWWKVSSQATDWLEFYLDGVLQTGRISGEQDWRREEFQIIAPGPHTLRWRYAKDSTIIAGADAGWLDEITFTAAAPVPLGQAIDAPAAMWTTGGAAPWAGWTYPSHDGTDAVRSGAISNGGESSLETTVTGPGTVTFWWRVSSEAGFDTLTFRVDDVPQGAGISGESGWLKVARTVGPGAHTFRWTYAKDPTIAAGADAAWVDEFTFTPATPPPLADAVDDTTRDYWSTGAGGVWTRDTVVSRDGVDSARSSVTADDGESVFETTVEGPGVLSFWWKVSSQATDWLEFYIDGTLQTGRISGETGWQQVSIPLDLGPQVVTWRYVKDASGSAGDDAGWIDGITFSPPPAVPLATALDAPNLTWTTGGAAPWTGWTFPSFDGIDAGVSGPLNDGEESWFETTVNGPGSISFDWRVSSEADFDLLEFSIDSVVQDAISGVDGGSAWELRQFAVTGPGAHVLRWRYVKDASGSAGSDLALVDQVLWLPEGSYLEWASQYFGTSELLDPLVTGIDVDDDGDGIPNGVEAVFALDPVDGIDLGASPSAVLDTSSGNPRLALEFFLAETPPNDLRCKVQVSDTLEAGSWQTIAQKIGTGPWTGSATITEGVPAGGVVLVRVRDVQDIAATPRRFMQFIVVQP